MHAGRRAYTLRADARGRSERGATFILALLVILVCIGVGSAVLAAATASSGQFAGQDESDARYYAVTSAAQLFQDSLGKNGELTLVLAQTQEGTVLDDADTQLGEEDADGIRWDGSVDFAGMSSTPAAAKLGGYDFLSELTLYALCGNTTGGGAWAAPFSCGTWVNPDGTLEELQEVTYAVSPRGEGALDGADVVVTARLNSNWTLELDFRNGTEAAEAAGAAGPQFHLYMLLTGSAVTTDDAMEETADGKVVRTRKTEVNWHVQQIVPGRGLS